MESYEITVEKSGVNFTVNGVSYSVPEGTMRYEFVGQGLVGCPSCGSGYALDSNFCEECMHNIYWFDSNRVRFYLDTEIVAGDYLLTDDRRGEGDS